MNEDYEIRIGACGQVDSGKSTLLSILTNPNNNKGVVDLDNGRGNARKRIFNHQHEKESGRTSSIAYCYKQYENNGCTFVDLAGHEKYLSTTTIGISGSSMDYIMILMSANTGTVPRITKEHISLALAFKIPIIFVVTKIDMDVELKKNNLLSKIKKIMCSNSGCNKIMTEINNQEDINDCIENMKIYNDKLCPLFQISNTTGENINLLQSFISKLKPKLSCSNTNDIGPLFLIDDIFHISGIGIVIYGILKKGLIKKNDTLLLGPNNGEYKHIVIKTIHNNNREYVNELKGGQSGCFWIKTTSKIKLLKSQIKRGMVLIKDKKITREFKAYVTILHNPSTIRLRYQPVIHCGNINQSAEVCEILDDKTNTTKEFLRAGDKAKIKFKFLFHPEFIEDNAILVFREGQTKGIGRIISN